MNQNDGNKFEVLFYGKFIPLQGVPYIIRAAKLVEERDKNVHFDIIGNGQTYKEAMKIYNELKPGNVSLTDFISFTEVPSRIARCDVSLGIFGDTNKTKRVIPNKVYEAIAMGKAVISSDTPASRELFTDRENILFCKVADSQDLADKILELKNNVELRKHISQGGYALFSKCAKPVIIGKKLLESLKNVK